MLVIYIPEKVSYLPLLDTALTLSQFSNLKKYSQQKNFGKARGHFICHI